MTRTPKRTFLICLSALAVAMACVPAIATPVIPTVDPEMVSTIIAQTVNAAGSQTAAALPSSTPTPSVTPTQNTPTVSPTATSTVILIPPTLTPIVIPTLTRVPSLGGSGTSSDNYACEVIRVTPQNGSAFEPRQDFDVIWTVANIGRRNWERTDVDYVYSSGDKFHKISGYDLSENVRSGNALALGVDMRAPKDPGTYSTTWTLRIGENTFCPLRYTIIVR